MIYKANNKVVDFVGLFKRNEKGEAYSASVGGGGGGE
jgi:hypothetical protein